MQANSVIDIPMIGLWLEHLLVATFFLLFFIFLFFLFDLYVHSNRTTIAAFFATLW